MTSSDGQIGSAFELLRQQQANKEPINRAAAHTLVDSANNDNIGESLRHVRTSHAIVANVDKLLREATIPMDPTLAKALKDSCTKMSDALSERTTRLSKKEADF
jgi:hypothetical protein